MQSDKIFCRTNSSYIYKWEPDWGLSYGKFSYKCKGIEIIGRDKELEKLVSFLKSDERFKISAVTGSAGSGKSRLVYELCIQKIVECENEWEIICLNSYMLCDLEMQEFKAVLEKKENVLIVIDYLLQDIEGIGKWINCLRRKMLNKDKYKIRIILIERMHVETKYHPYWYIKLIEKNKLINSCNVSDFVKLNVLDDGILQEIFVKYVTLKKSNSAYCDEKLSEVAHEIIKNMDENCKNPLFVMYVADIWLDSPNSKKSRWSKEETLKYIIEKEEDRIRCIFEDEKTTESLLKILIYVMMLSGIKIENVKLDFLNDELRIMREVYGSRNPGVKHVMDIFSETNDEKYIKSVYPEVVEELFCLEYLNRIKNEELDEIMFGKIINQAWKVDCRAFSGFLSRVIEDFPVHEIVNLRDILRVPEDMNDEMKLAYANVLMEYTYCIKDLEAKYQDIIVRFEKIVETVEKEKCKQDIYEMFAIALFNISIKHEEDINLLVNLIRQKICPSCGRDSICKICDTLKIYRKVRRNVKSICKMAIKAE